MDKDTNKGSTKGDSRPKGGGGNGMVQVPAGVLTFLQQFLKNNPDLAREIGMRMNSIINRQQISTGNRLAPPPGNSGDGKNMYRSAVGSVGSTNMKTKAAPKADGAQ